MNKIQKFFLSSLLVVLSFFFGFRVGDSRGYSDGYTEGYRYDCRAEIANLYNQVKAQKSLYNVTQENLKILVRENDSLRDPRSFVQRIQDSIEAKKIFSADSSKHWKRARAINDSLTKKLGVDYSNLIQPNGRVNVGLCMLDKNLRDLPECQAGWELK